MPEFNRVFNEGKMNRDLDERLVPQGQYREGVNIEVTSTKNNNVGSVKNRKGNSLQNQEGLALSGNELYGLSPQAECIDYVVAEETQRVYYFIKNAKFDDGTGVSKVNSDIIAEFDPNTAASRIIFIDVKRIRIANDITGSTFSVAPDQLNVLSFQYAGVIPDIANFPVQAFRVGMTLPDGNVLTKFSNVGGTYNLVFANPVDLASIVANDLVLTKESVLGIDRANKYIASNYVDGLLFFTNGVDEPKKINIEESFLGTSQQQSLNKHTSLISNLMVGTNVLVEEEHVTVIRKNPDGVLNVILDTQVGSQQGSVVNVTVGFNDGEGNPQLNHFLDFSANPVVPDPVGSIYNFVTVGAHGFKEGQTLDFTSANNQYPVEPIEILVSSVTGPTSFTASLVTQLQSSNITEPNYIDTGGLTNVDLFVAEISLDKSLHEDKFVRFSYRWKYRDGEYSGFAPFTNVCFLPGAYDFSAEQGENSGSINKTKQIILKDFAPSYMPKDVAEIELLFKEENLAAVYSVRKFNVSDIEAQKIGTGSHKGVYSADAETFSQALPPNQILRPFDQVPRHAKAQEISANRVIYGNIKENYNLTSDDDNVNADISTGISSEKFETIQVTQSNNFIATGIDVFSQNQLAFENANDFSGDVENGGPLYANDLIFGFGGSNPTLPTSSFNTPQEDDYNYPNALQPLYSGPASSVQLPLQGAFVDDNEGADVVTDAQLDGNFNRYPGGFGVGTSDITLGDGVYHVVTNGTHNISFEVGARGEVQAGGIDPNGNSISDAFLESQEGQWGEVLDDKNKVLPLRLAVQKLIGEGFVTIHATPYRTWKPVTLGLPNNDTESISNENETLGYNDSVVRFIYHSDFPGYPSDKPKTRTLAFYWGEPYNPDFFNDNPNWNSPNDWTDPEWIQDTVFGGGLNVIMAGDYSALQDGAIAAESQGVQTGAYVANILKQRLDFFWKAEWHDTKIAQPNPTYSFNNVAVELQAGDQIRVVLQRDPQFINKYGNANCKIRLQSWSYNFKTSNQDLAEFNLIPWFNPLYVPGSNFNMISAPQVQKTNIYPSQAQLPSSGNDLVSVNSRDSFAKWLQTYFQTENAPLAPLLDVNVATDYYQTTDAFPALVFPNLSFLTPGATGGRNTTWNQQMDLGFGETLENNRFTNRWDIGQHFTFDPNGETHRTFVDSSGFLHETNPTPIQEQRINNLRNILELDGPDATLSAILPNNIGRSSIKSFRTYKVGIVYRDKFGRETPVLPSSNNIVLNNNASDTINSFSFTCNHQAPDFADSYKFFIKENSEEYYNLVIDRIYDGGDNTVWISFSSSDRNKVTEETILIFKKQHGADYMAHAEFFDANNIIVNSNPSLEYPILAISNEAPPRVLNQAGVATDFDQLSANANIEKIQGKFFVKVKLDDAFKRNVIGDAGNNGILIDLTTKPGVFETKPVENKDLDIYYEMSQAFPIKLTQENVKKFIQPGATIDAAYFENESSTLFSIFDSDPIIAAGAAIFFTNIQNLQGNTVQSVIGSFTEDTGQNSDFCEIKLSVAASTWANNFLTPAPTPGSRLILTFKNPNGTVVTSDVAVFNTSTSSSIFINNFTHPTLNSAHKSTISFPWFNCFAFANGVESNRIRDRFNKPFISNGVKASTIFEEYSEEINKNKLIFSGIYNSKSSTNKTNQFIIGEGITKDLNPDYGQIQRLLARDTDLVTFCEDKVLRILSNKDALFNADGNTNVVASKNVLGTATPFVGEYGISYHPESVAKYGYRVYFTDTKRGKVLRLSMDGLTPISDYGMSDFFFETFHSITKDSKVIGSYDNSNGEYNLTIPTAIGQEFNVPGSYGYAGYAGEYTAPVFSGQIGGYTISFAENNNGWTSFRTYVKEAGFSSNDKYYTFKNGRIWRHQINQLRNNYYGLQFNSSIKFVFNDASNIVKSFKAVNYEGTQAKIYQSLTNSEFYDNVAKDGWYVEKISTDIQDGQVINFRNKENKWHKYITGAVSDNIDLSELSAQGFGLPSGTELGDGTGGDGLGGSDDDGGGNSGSEDSIAIILGCTNSSADNYNPAANTEDGSCIIAGCTDPSATNYNFEATEDDGSCEELQIPGCTDPTAANFNINATEDDGSCVQPEPEQVLGCTDANANNFNPLATENDGSCIFLGCTNFNASNFDPNATEDDGSCIFPGCTDPQATNFNAVANQDDGSCIFPVFGCTNSTSENFNPDAEVDDGSCILLGCDSPTADNFNPLATVDDGSCTFCGFFSALLVSSANPTTFGGSNGYIQATGQGGSSDYSVVVYDQDGPQFGQQQNPFALTAGTYTVIVTDSGDIQNADEYGFELADDACTDSFEVTLEDPPLAQLFTWLQVNDPILNNSFVPANPEDAGTAAYNAELTLSNPSAYNFTMQVEFNGDYGLGDITYTFEDITFTYANPAGNIFNDPPNWLTVSGVNADGTVDISISQNNDFNFMQVVAIRAMIPDPNGSGAQISYADLIIIHPNSQGGYLGLPDGWAG